MGSLPLSLEGIPAEPRFVGGPLLQGGCFRFFHRMAQVHETGMKHIEEHLHNHTHGATPLRLGCPTA